MLGRETTVMILQVGLCLGIASAQPARPDPVKHPDSPLMLAGIWVPSDPHAIVFDALPSVPSEHVIVSDVRAVDHVDPKKADSSRGGVNQHNYLVFHDQQFWIMWSDGPGVEDRVGQRVKFATSGDGLHWSEPDFLTPEPPNSGPGTAHYGTRSDQGFRWIARGFWVRNSELLALASLDEAADFFGPSLSLRAFRWNGSSRRWDDAGQVHNNTINNFAPEKLANGQWMMSRRMFDYKKTGVHFLVGGVDAIDQWQSFPVLGSSSELTAEEPLWWRLPDDHLMALFRDNRKSGFLYRSFSIDQGKTWSVPVKTNFPDATSKIHGFRLHDGRYVLVSNPNPKQRDPLAISLSNDGIMFTQMGKLIGGRRVDYPHAIEHDGNLFIAFSGAKQTVEVLKVRIDGLTRVLNASQPMK